MENTIKLLKKNKKLIIVISLILVILISIILNNKEKMINPVYASSDIVEQIENVNIETEIETLKIDIKGEINNPGVYELELGKRVIDAIEMSGGLTSEAITRNINLSKRLVDEMVIYIPNEEICQNQIEENSSLVNINTATLEQLDSLSGIGESKAQAIIEYRKENIFNKIEDLMNVSGISESLFDKIKNEITI